MCNAENREASQRALQFAVRLGSNASRTMKVDGCNAEGFWQNAERDVG